MSVVLLVRHGQATFGLGTYDRLSDGGQAQARRLGEVLGERGTKVERVICGNLERQRETADIVASVLGGKPVSIDPRWDEYDHLPLIARVKPMYRKQWLMVADLARSGNPNRKLQELIDQALVEWVGPEAGAGGMQVVGERTPAPADDGVLPFTSYAARCEAALDAAADEPGVTVVVSSAGTITAAVAPLIGIPYGAWPALQRVMVNTSVTKVVKGQRGLSLISLNEHGHLEGAQGVKITYR